MMKKAITTAMLLGLTFCVTPSASYAQAGSAPTKRIGLVLEGGGALGFAHVGVLRVLEEERIPVHLIAGTSMGSIVGAAYASGNTIQELDNVIATTDWDKLFNEAIPRRLVNFRQKAGREGELFGDSKIGIKDGSLITATAFVEGQKIEPLFQRLFGKVPASVSFDDLPVPFRAVAADIETGEAVVIDSGSLAMAARASMSVPGFFSPVNLNGHLLVDGGITNNFPVDVALNMKPSPDVIIGVEFNFTPRKRDQLQGPLAISAQILDLLLERTSASRREMMRPHDIMIHPEVGAYTSTSFASAREIMKAGEDAARALVPQLRRYAISEAEYNRYRKKRTGLSQQLPTIDFIQVRGVPEHRGLQIQKVFNVPLGEPLDRDLVERQINDVFQTGEYRKVGYTVEEKEGKYGLIINAEEKEWLKNYFRLGFALDDNLDSNSSFAAAADVRFRDLNDAGAYADIQAAIGRSPRLYGEWFQPVSRGSMFFVAPELEYLQQSVLLTQGSDEIAEYQRESGTVGLKGGLALGRFGEFTTGIRRGTARLNRQIGAPTLSEFDFEIGDYVTRLNIDQYDNPDFPTAGYRFSAVGIVARESIGSSTDFKQSIVTAGVPFTYKNTTLILGGEAGSSSDDLSPERSFSLGGFFDISGYIQNSLIADNYGIGRGVLFHRVAEGGSSLLPFGGYIGGTMEFASLRTEIDEIGDQPNIIAGSAFVGVDTPLLPFYLGFGLNNEQERSIYLALGRLSRTRR